MLSSHVWLPGMLMVLLVSTCLAEVEPLVWKRLADLPNSVGVAGAFGGVVSDKLLVAGGANFPAAVPWEGGKKVWHDTVFVLDRPDRNWIIAGKLPRALGYGISATHRDTVVCVGGSDERRHYAEAFRLSWQAGKITTIALPALPISMANGCGALVGDTLFVAGGQEKPDSQQALGSVYQLDLSAAEPHWVPVEKCPGSGRIFATAVACDGGFWLIGGAELVDGADGNVERRYLRDAYRFDSAGGWKRIADLPRAVVAAPSPALCDETGIFVFGGDDGSQLGLQRPEDHQGFSKQVLRYDLKKGEWQETGAFPAARVTAPCVAWNHLGVIASGEVRPGVRSPEVWSVLWPPRSK